MNKLFLSLLLCSVIGVHVIPASAKGRGKASVDSVSSVKAGEVAGFKFQTGPIPDWVSAVAPEPGAHVAAAPLHYELIDEQARVEGDGTTFYNHVRRVVGDASGLGTAAQIQLDFDPSYQTLVFNQLEIWRDGRRIDKLKKKYVQFLKRETRLEYRSYDGRVTASIVLDDVRVGDKIEYAFTVRGTNPVFDGKFLHISWTAAEKGPVLLYQFRLLAPEGRAIAHAAAPEVKVADTLANGIRQTTFRRHSIAQWQSDATAPDSAYIKDMIQFSEYKGWSDVASWGQNLFTQAAVPSPAVRKLAADILANAKTPAERLERALDFVQKEVRYFGMEFGTGSHRPAAPSTVIEQRFGDCKDKVVLLIAILKELDMEAAPVLVSTHYRGDTGLLLPGPLAFDHVIAAVKLDGKTLWLDGTRSHQTGPLAQRQSIGLRKGLLLQPGASSLSELPGADAEERIAVEDIFSVTNIAGDVALESRIVYYGENAEFMREAIAAQSLAPIEQRLTAEYGRFYPKLRMSAPINVEELAGKNALRIVQYFSLPQFWSFPEQKLLGADVVLWNAFDALQHSNEPVRSRPMRIQSPGIYRHDISFGFNEDIYRNPDFSHFEDSSAHYSYRLDYALKPRAVNIGAELHLLGDAVSPEEWKVFSEKSLKIRPRFSAYVAFPAIALAQTPKVSGDIAALIDAMKKGQESAITSVQAEAKVRNIALTAQLNSGRLNGPLRAQTLHARGEVLDQVGQYDAAARDFDEALALVPDESDNYLASAINAFARGKDALAIERAGKALQLAPSSTEPLNIRSFALYYTGKYAQAKEDALALLKNHADVERGYAAIWLYLIARRMGEDGVAAVEAHLPSATSPPWPYPVLQFMIGKIDFQQAAKAAGDGAKNASQLCELYFYVGEKYLLDGDRRRARAFFQKAVDTGVVEVNEYLMAQRRLKSLE